MEKWTTTIIPCCVTCPLPYLAYRTNAKLIVKYQLSDVAKEPMNWISMLKHCLNASCRRLFSMRNLMRRNRIPGSVGRDWIFTENLRLKLSFVSLLMRYFSAKPHEHSSNILFTEFLICHHNFTNWIRRGEI